MLSCLHPTEPNHVDILKEVCERFLFVQKGRVSQHADFASVLAMQEARAYLGRLSERAAA